jgi:hypothetical protein
MKGEMSGPRVPETAWTWMARFRTIRLIVQPTPPRDYTILISGEDCLATERSLYKVPDGFVTVRVIMQFLQTSQLNKGFSVFSQRKIGEHIT